jgi:hypothetical protein
LSITKEELEKEKQWFCLVKNIYGGRFLNRPYGEPEFSCRGEEIACNLVAACRLPLGRPLFIHI